MCMPFQIVTITSQGQITIPAAVRRALGLKKTGKALVYHRQNQVVLEPIKSVMSLAGIIKSQKMKGKKLKEILAAEQKAIKTASIKRGLR